MLGILKSVWQAYVDFQEKYEHPLTKDHPLASSPLPTLAIVGCWLYFSLRCGPRFMKDRKPFELKNTMLAYNLIQIVLCVLIFYWGGKCGWFSRYNWRCQPLPWPPNLVADDYIAADVVWWYYITKLTDLLDTVFFVLRKKNNQITTLHVYHHALAPIFGWMGVKFVPGGHGTLVGWINSFVHIIMYTYYLIAGLGPQYEKYLWWKKHLTHIQLIQFLIIFIHNFSVLFIDCAYPKLFNCVAIIEAIIFIYLFGKFYVKNYIKTKNTKTKLYSRRYF